MKILLVASTGGHWVQLKRLLPAFDGAELSFISTNIGHETEVFSNFYCVNDASAWSKLSLLVMFVQVFLVVYRVRPDFVITTGAAPGLAAVVIGYFFRAKTIWIDSIANVDAISRSGVMAKPFCTVWISQWRHLSNKCGCKYWGAVL